MKKILSLLAMASLCLSLYAQQNDYLTFRLGPLQSLHETDPVPAQPAHRFHDLQGLDARIQYGHDISNHLSWILSMSLSEGAISDSYIGYSGDATQFEDIAIISGVDLHHQFGGQARHKVGFSLQAGLQYYFQDQIRLRVNTEYPTIVSADANNDHYLLGLAFESSLYYQYNVTDRCAVGLYGMLQYQTSFVLGPCAFSASWGACTTIKL